jgi:soluble lytic murein transglycosylase-like protein
MKLSIDISHSIKIKSFLVLTSLLVGTSAIADETSATQNIIIEPAIASTSVENKRLNTTAGTLKNPNSMLVAMAFKFKSNESSPNSYAEVVASYCKKAKLGDADAQFALGWMYANGKGVSADEKIAAQLFTMAAEQGHASAQESLTQLSNVSPSTTLLACLLPDPPETLANSANIDSAQNEKKAISEKTAALFYSQRHILKIVNKLAPRYDIDANLAMSFIAVESGFNVLATSPKNAQGLMQLIPETAQRFGVKDAYKAEDNIKGGLAYLRWLLAYYEGNVELVAAAYNAGEGAVDKYKGVPPYAETRMYVKKIAKLYNNTSHPYQDNLVKKTSSALDMKRNKTM